MAQLNRDDVALKTAKNLTGILGDNLINEVNIKLQDPQYMSTDESNDPGWVDIAALIVAIASFSVQIHDSFFTNNQRYPSSEELYLKIDNEVAEKDSSSPLSPALKQHLETVIQTTVDAALDRQNISSP
jgi:hypothetical protein